MKIDMQTWSVMSMRCITVTSYFGNTMTLEVVDLSCDVLSPADAGGSVRI